MSFEERARVALLEVVAEGTPPPVVQTNRRGALIAVGAAAVLVAAGAAVVVSRPPAQPTPVRLTAAGVLTEAAAAADRRAAVEPRADQWFYQRVRIAAPREGQPAEGEYWFPASLAGGRGPTHRFGGVDRPFGGAGFARQAEDYQWLRKLPADPGKMLSLVGSGRMGMLNLSILMDRPLPPRVAGAVYRAVARFAGATVVPEVTDPMGRHGVAVSFSGGSAGGKRFRGLYVFDPKSYAYLGSMYVDSDGKNVGGAAVTPWVLVDKFGQRD